jgi:hypothetical protein
MKDDPTRLGTVINLFVENNSDSNPTVQTDVFYAYCKASYAIKPNYLNSYGCALAANSKDSVDMQEVIKFYVEARDLAPSERLSALMSIRIAKATLNTAGQWPSYEDKDGRKRVYGDNTQQYENWSSQMIIAIGNLKRVVGLSSSLSSSTVIDDRKIPNEARHWLGICYMRLGLYNNHITENNEAIKWFKEGQACGSDYAVNDLRNIEACQKKIDDAQKRLRADAKAAKAAAEYQEYLKRKKAEEDFWKGGH